MTKELTKTGKQWTQMLAQYSDQLSAAQRAALTTALDRAEAGIRTAPFADMLNEENIQYKLMNARVTVAMPAA